MIKAGIIDPTKVTRTALQNAASVAALLLTTAVMVADVPEEKSGSVWNASRRRNGRNVLRNSGQQ